MKRLNIEERMIIQACLIKNMSVTEIATRLKRHKSTVSREISNHLIIKKSVLDTPCIHDKEYFLCNACPYKLRSCVHLKHFYDFEDAHDTAEKMRTIKRKKINLPLDDIRMIDEILIDEIRNRGQSLHHVFIANKQLQKICCERTIRRYIYKGVFTVKAHELRRFVRYEHAPKKSQANKQHVKNLGIILGRTYSEYLSYCQNHKRMNIVQYDSVIGKLTDEKAILTITFKKYNFQFGFLIRKSIASNVTGCIRKLFRKLGSNVVKEIFPINIADNGIEFSTFDEIEFDTNGERVCRTFFTTPYRSNDKSECERNHELIRYFIPKGKSLDNLTQENLNFMFSNINSYVRKSKNDMTPYDIVLKRFGKKFLDTIGIYKVEKKKVVMNRIL